MKLKRIVEQAETTAQFYDLGKDFFSFIRAMNSTTEDVKTRFGQAISVKLKGKKIRARASRGYKQFEKDYEIDVANVSLDDYYDNYVVVVKGTNGKEYFLKPGFKVQILGAAEQPEQPSPQTPEPSKTQTQPSPPKQQSSSAPQSKQPEPPEQQSVQEEGGPELVRKYPVESIERDLSTWLPPLLMQSNANLKQFIPRDGVARTKDRKTVASYAVTIPVNELPGLTVDQVKSELSRASRLASSVSDIESFYTLDKFDTRGDKYVIIIRKITNY